MSNKRVLIIAHTYYQLILVIQMRLTIFNGAEVVLLFSDYSKGSVKICSRINDMKIFNQICHIEMQDILHNRGWMKKIKNVFDIGLFNFNSFTAELKDIKNLYFDEFICYNYRIDTYGLYSILSNINPRIKMSFMEEGILSYNTEIENTMARKIIRVLRHLRNKKALEDSIGNAYCFYPELYRGTFDVFGISNILPGNPCASVLCKLFGLDNLLTNYKQKYIFFTSVYDFEGGEPIHEHELVCKITNIIGKENLMIKVHPRDTRGIYEKEGFIVDENSSIPWEAIQLSRDFSDKVFMTVTSGSVLAGSFMAEKPIKTYYMYKLCDISGNYGAQKTSQDIYNLLNNESIKSVLEKVKIVDSIEEILE